jgi:hypothetical protein
VVGGGETLKAGSRRVFYYRCASGIFTWLPRLLNDNVAPSCSRTCRSCVINLNCWASASRPAIPPTLLFPCGPSPHSIDGSLLFIPTLVRQPMSATVLLCVLLPWLFDTCAPASPSRLAHLAQRTYSMIIPNPRVLLSSSRIFTLLLRVAIPLRGITLLVGRGHDDYDVLREDSFLPVF